MSCLPIMGCDLDGTSRPSPIRVPEFAFRLPAAVNMPIVPLTKGTPFLLRALHPQLRQATEYVWLYFTNFHGGDCYEYGRMGCDTMYIYGRYGRFGETSLPLRLGLMTTLLVMPIFKKLYTLTLKIKVACSSETSVSVHISTWCHNLQHRNPISVYWLVASIGCDYKLIITSENIKRKRPLWRPTIILKWELKIQSVKIRWR
jgi:hypothetical protein